MMDELGISKSLRLKHLSETRWSAWYDAVNTVRKAIPGIIESLGKLSSDRSVSPAVYSEIQGILANVCSFKFLLQTCIWYNILSTIKSLSDYLQSPTINLSSASSLVKGTERSIAATCEKFEVFYEEASTWATELEIEPVLPSGRVQRRKQMPGELAMDEPICDPKISLKLSFSMLLLIDSLPKSKKDFLIYMQLLQSSMYYTQTSF